MKRLYSVLRVTDRTTGCFYVVVCETLNDEKEVIRHADNLGRKVTNIVAAEDNSNGIFLNDF